MASANYDMILNDGWRFHYGQLRHLGSMPIDMYHETSKAGGYMREYDLALDGEGWEQVSVPHDWMVSLPMSPENDPACGYRERGAGWYYLNFTLSEDEIESARLIFDGVLGRTTVFVNGTVAARNNCGYNRFSCEIGDYLIPNGENSIALYVDARRWEGWWYEGAGLYRPVKIEFRKSLRLDAEKCFFRSEKRDGDWYLVCDVPVIGARGGETLCVTLYAPDGSEVTQKALSATEANEFEIRIDEPLLWSPEEPHLYRLVCELRERGDGIIDRMENDVGLRDIVWTADNGMYLNGQKYTVKGICCHQDHAGVGAAVTRSLFEYRIRQLKLLGVNAYRCAHHPPSEELLRVCDREGILVMVENRHFSVSDEVMGYVDSMVCVSRNHPSVFLYCLFNEERWQGQKRGRRIAEKLRARVRALDSTRAVTAAQNGELTEEANASDVLDVIGVNYFLNQYDAAHARIPTKAILGTENAPTYATRGVYTSDPEAYLFASYGDEWAAFSESLEETLINVKDKSYVAGAFVWCGFDHRGEPTPYGWPSVLSHWGMMDVCGFPKDTAHLLAAFYREELSAHLLPHWNHRDGDAVRVCTFTNGDEAELYVNGRSLGVKRVERCRAEWNTPFEAGEISVTVRRNGESVTCRQATAGDAAYLVLEDATPYAGQDRHVINIYVTDKNGIVLPDFSETVTLEAWDGILHGVGNGDPNAHHIDTGNKVALFHGRAQAILSGKGITASCDTLGNATLQL